MDWGQAGEGELPAPRGCCSAGLWCRGRAVPACTSDCTSPKRAQQKECRDAPSISGGVPKRVVLGDGASNRTDPLQTSAQRWSPGSSIMLQTSRPGQKESHGLASCLLGQELEPDLLCSQP